MVIKKVPLALIFVTLFALAQGLIYLQHYLGWRVNLGYDEAIYAIFSQRFLRGDFIHAFHPYWNPGFPLASIPFYFITRKWELAQIMLSMTSHLLLIFATYFTIRFFSNFLAILTAFLVAFSPTLSKLTLAWGFTEPIYILFYWIAAYMGFRALDSKRFLYYSLAGLFFGLAFLVRTEALFALIVFLVISFLSFVYRYKNKFWLKIINKLTFFGLLMVPLPYIYFIISQLSKPKAVTLQLFRPPSHIITLTVVLVAFTCLGLFFSWNKKNLITQLKSSLPRIFICVILFLIVNLPYLLTISIQLGKPTISGKDAYARSGHPFSLESDRFTTWAQEIWSIDYPNYHSPFYQSGETFKLYLKRIETSLDAFWKSALHYLQLYGHNNTFTQKDIYLFWFGFIASLFFKKLSRFSHYLLSLWVFNFFIIAQFMGDTNRYLAFSFPMILLGQSVGIWVISLGLSNILSKINLNRNVMKVIVLVLFMTAYFRSNVDLSNFTTIQVKERHSDQKIIADWLKSQNISLIMARTEGLQFYADAKMIYLPAATPEQIVDYAKAWGVEYIVARPAEASWDYMIEIVNPSYSHPDLTLIHSFDEGTLIWKVKLSEQEKKYNFRTVKI